MTQHQTSMLSGRLIRVIEGQAEELTRGTVEILEHSPRTPAYHRVPYHELHDRVYAIYHDLGKWLEERTDGTIQGWYNGLGKQRFDERIPLADVLWALVLIKHHLRERVAASTTADSAIELYRKQELDQLIGQFFDRALCYTAEGYQRAASPQGEQWVGVRHEAAGDSSRLPGAY